MTDYLIVITEIIAAIGYLLALIFTINYYKNSNSKVQLNIALTIMAMFFGILISLMDVFQWTNIGGTFLAEGIEEELTPLFSFVWMTNIYFMIKRLNKKTMNSKIPTTESVKK